MYLAQSNMEDPIPLIAIIFAFNGIEADKCFFAILFYNNLHVSIKPYMACLPL